MKVSKKFLFYFPTKKSRANLELNCDKILYLSPICLPLYSYRSCEYSFTHGSFLYSLYLVPWRYF